MLEEVRKSQRAQRTERREKVEIKLEGQTVPDQAECYRSVDFNGTPK